MVSPPKRHLRSAGRHSRATKSLNWIGFWRKFKCEGRCLCVHRNVNVRRWTIVGKTSHLETCGVVGAHFCAPDAVLTSSQLQEHPSHHPATLNPPQAFAQSHPKWFRAAAAVP